ncbi:MAG: 1,4-dihydroxy-2-naphthoate polyprenyltransferase [Acidimicrobiales bacterium]
MSSPLANNPWIAGARLRTLPAAIVPVAVGTGAAFGEGIAITAWRAAAAMFVALALQIATNFANDYSDGVRGTDEGRTGPARLVGSGAVDAKHVKLAAFAMFGVAALAGLSLVVAVGPELILVGIASIAAGWFYTGGSRPYGYAGFGELFVFVFFGLVATMGSTYVQIEQLTTESFLAAFIVGFFATALLVTNNLRDIPTDKRSSKNTLAVRLGDLRTRTLYVGLLVAAAVTLGLLSVLRPWAALGFLAFPLLFTPVTAVRNNAVGAALVPVLVATARAQLVLGIFLTFGLIIGGAK